MTQTEPKRSAVQAPAPPPGEDEDGVRLIPIAKITPSPLQAHNGRDALIDAYQEALDLCVYLRQAIEERNNITQQRNQ